LASNYGRRYTKVLINLLGPIILHPYADRDELSFLTKDTRPKSLVTAIHDGLVYEQQGGSRHVLIESYWQAQEGVIRTAVPLSQARGRKYHCGHVWDSEHGGFNVNNRIVSVRLDQDILIVAPTGGQPLMLDLGLEMELTQEKRTLWDLLAD
jgi:hypothetical protein